MYYTLQLHADSGNWASPQADDVRHACNRKGVADWLADWAETVGRYDNARCASALVWRGHLDDVADQYPDYLLTIGPRGGIIWQPA